MEGGGQTLLVQRVSYEAANGPIPAGKVIRCTCETPGCVNPACLVSTSYRKIALDCGKLGLMSGPLRTRKIAQAKQSASQYLSRDMVREIRNSPESGVALSARLGLSQNLISKVRLHKVWKDFGGFAGLIN